MDTSEERGIDEMEMDEYHLLDSDFKLKYFGYGEWVEEPDRVNFIHKGYSCKIIRICAREPYCMDEVYYGGHLCGYVKLDETHPYHGKGYQDMNIDCHGGITYAERSEWVDHPEENKFWIGFDCGHSGDFIPSSEMFKKRHNKPSWIEKMNEIFDSSNLPDYLKPTYKNLNFCIEECKSIVDQLIVIAEQGENINDLPPS